MSAAPTRTIGKSQVHPIGYGAMGLAAFYGEAKTQEQVNEVFDVSQFCLFPSSFPLSLHD